MGLEACKRPRLVHLHQPAVADHVGGDDRGEPALWSGLVHLSGSFAEEIRSFSPSIDAPRADAFKDQEP